ncbi:MAG: acyl-CoA dehydrogenase family protein [Pseudomonadales bacterium]
MMTLARYIDEIESLVIGALVSLRGKCESAGKVDTIKLDHYQQAVFDLAVCKAEVEAARSLALYAPQHGVLEEDLARVFVAEVIDNISGRLRRHAKELGLESAYSNEISIDFVNDQLSSKNLERLGEALTRNHGEVGARGLDEEKAMIAATFRQFADKVVAPLAESIHREDRMIPDEVLTGLKALGCFGLSVPERFGGLLPDDHEDSLGMIVVTEELSRASLGGAGSLITRPEIMARALLEGGTKEQQSYWLPKLASGEPLCGICITEPDYGSDVASIRLKATAHNDGWRLSGSKTWSTFAGKSGVLLTLARTDPDVNLGHRGLTLFIVEKPSFDGHEFEVTQPGGGRLVGKAIPTVGYRGMHSFQLFYDDFFVPSSHVIGEGQGVGRGFYFTMRGFMGGRIQTAARACGVMQAAFEKAISYAGERKVFGRAIGDYQLNRIKLARMAAYLSASRQFTYDVGRLMDSGKGQMEASLVKLFACKAAEWVTREAMQIHGGMGYAEESAVSRYWLDARVLSIFEGTEETLALKVVGRSLVENATWH